MDCNKVGKLIADLRKERNMTQKELAEMLHLSDRTISKWECGNGCPACGNILYSTGECRLLPRKTV